MLIFIGGTGRCGTSIVRQCLGEHRAIYAPQREPRIVVSPGGILDLVQAFAVWDPWTADDALHRFFALCNAVGNKEAHDWVRGTRVIAETRAVRSDSGRRVMYETEPEQLDALALTRVALGSPTEEHMVDDTPYSVCQRNRIFAAYRTDAAVFSIVRHPRDVLASMLRMRWAPDNADLCACRIAGVLKQTYDFIRLEDIVADPKAHLSTILKRVGLEWEDACAGPLDPDKAHIGRGASLSKEGVAAYEHRLKPWAQQLGYKE